MPQISLSIDEVTLKKVESAASRQNVSISKWVADQIRTKVDPVYPKGYEVLFGSVADETLVRPDQPRPEQDGVRESLQCTFSIRTPFEVVPFDDHVCYEYATVRKQTEDEGKVVGPSDLPIAATARFHKGTLVTRNTMEFTRIRA